MSPIGADVLYAIMRIAGYHAGSGQIWSRIKTRRRNRSRQAFEAMACTMELALRLNNFMAGRIFYDARQNRMSNGLLPSRTDVFEPIDIHADPIDLRIRCIYARGHRNFISMSF